MLAKELGYLLLGVTRDGGHHAVVLVIELVGASHCRKGCQWLMLLILESMPVMKLTLDDV